MITSWSSSPSVICGPLGSPKLFQGVREVKTIFMVILRCHWPFSLCWHCSDDAKAMVENTTGALTQSKAVGPNCISSHCILYYQMLTVAKNTLPISFKIVLDETIKVIHLIEFQPLSTCPFNILCDETGNMHKECLRHELLCLSPRKSTCVIVWVMS